MNRPPPPVETLPDPLAETDEHLGAGARLTHLHAHLRTLRPQVDRVAIALYDADTDALRTFVSSNGDEPTPLQHYEAQVEDAPALRELVREGRARLVQDLAVYDGGRHEHTRRIREAGYRASFALPFRNQGRIRGVVFFNSRRPQAFDEQTVALLELFARAVTASIRDDLARANTLLAALRTACSVAHARDPETGMHLRRIADYTRLIATELARTGQVPFADEQIEHLAAFSELHDIGKVGIRDEVLRKPDRLTDEEYAHMKEHTRIGRDLLETLLRHFDLQTLRGVDALRHVVELHHEALDGSGYPNGLRGEDIPIEARIVAVADVFDALTSPRVYKTAWSTPEALEHLRRLAGRTLDAACVEALARDPDRLDRLRHLHADDAAPAA
jgi:HD-GYP domain-containing protein (c-di-GMP phosphodiesterase class II)